MCFYGPQKQVCKGVLQKSSRDFKKQKQTVSVQRGILEQYLGRSSFLAKLVFNLTNNELVHRYFSNNLPRV